LGRRKRKMDGVDIGTEGRDDKRGDKKNINKYM